MECEEPVKVRVTYSGES